MSSSAVTALKDCIIWILLILFLTVPILLIKVWKLFVTLAARIFSPSLNLFSASDVMTIGDKFLTGLLLNIGFILKFDCQMGIQID